MVQQTVSSDVLFQADSCNISLNLPLYEEACVIIQKYMAERDFLNPIVHAPTLAAVIKGIYTKLQQKSPVERGHLLLFLSIIACATYTCSPYDEVCSLFPGHAEAASQSWGWVTASLSLVNGLRRSDQLSIECLQGQNILLKLICHIEGISVQTRGLLATSISMAREMGLHRIDLSSHNSPSSSNLRSSTEVEIARRLWWDLVVLDW